MLRLFNPDGAPPREADPADESNRKFFADQVARYGVAEILRRLGEPDPIPVRGRTRRPRGPA